MDSEITMRQVLQQKKKQKKVWTHNIEIFYIEKQV